MSYLREPFWRLWQCWWKMTWTARTAVFVKDVIEPHLRDTLLFECTWQETCWPIGQERWVCNRPAVHLHSCKDTDLINISLHIFSYIFSLPLPSHNQSSGRTVFFFFLHFSLSLFSLTTYFSPSFRCSTFVISSSFPKFSISLFHCISLIFLSSPFVISSTQGSSFLLSFCSFSNASTLHYSLLSILCTPHASCARLTSTCPTFLLLPSPSFHPPPPLPFRP